MATLPSGGRVHRTDAIDGDSIEAIFDPQELDKGLAFRQSLASDLMALLRGWTLGFCPLNAIERSISELIDVRITAEEYRAMPSRFDGEWLRGNFPGVAESMDRFIDKIKAELTAR